ncbi:uncharacterized protein PITG_10490 [Phytophthora infestans T30-4]|uniref:Uncharacterized protein n=1 Tax=Phytophthora infestans (strain T30-4) TaxID=403677 RepID=D0NFF7_PHYIT|nr:uncharacterized protein PITG_10490 [Phytophthora infestans T30-4]EEY56946.1 hypothetical protein PITG_10490 [Phytophthora infestans T30-4]|eukprot:XP_002902274.1 hypothetical protein PITG_10490 [Phytophthora infestans T30-4]
MEVEDNLSAAVAAKALASAEMGRRRSFIEATDRVHANRKLQKQNEERIQYKASRERAAQLEAAVAWTSIREQVAVEVRSKTFSWLDTRDAKSQILADANRIFQTDAKWIRDELERDPEHASATILPTDCRWQVFLEAPHGVVTRKLTKAFYLNTVTYEKYWCDEVALEDCQIIACEALIQTRIDEALARLNDKQTEWELQRHQNIAATRIQMMFRSRQARLVCRRIIRVTFIKRIEPSSGLVVYFNLARPHELRRKPPRLIGSDELLIPTESTTWVYRQDAHGAGYYERLDTRESSVGPPDHFILCARCSVNFVSRRKTATGARYCIGCYANIRFAARRATTNDPSADEESRWAKMPVQPANCMLCRNALADFICVDCNHDATCSRCFNAIHGRPVNNRTHATPVPLVNRANVVWLRPDTANVEQKVATR